MPLPASPPESASLPAPRVPWRLLPAIRRLLPAIIALLLVASPAAAGEPDDAPATVGTDAPATTGTDAPATTGTDGRFDCRYLTTEARPAPRGSGPFKGGAFPDDDVFRPLLADPKQPQFFASYQRLRSREVGESINAAFVAFGESFGLWGLRQRSGCDGLQVGLSGGVFAQFNLDAPSFDLVNSDFVIGLPVTLRRGLVSARLRLYHQSSHLGDEFLLGNPGFNRVNLSFEELEGLVSVERRWGRLYAGGGYLVHREPALDRGKVQWGLELRGPSWPSPVLRKALGDVFVVPVVGADFKAFEELSWTVNTSLAGGFEWSGPRATRRLRLLATYLRGFNPYGQFFDQKIESVGAGFHFAF